ncbi:MAG TPA: glycosyltransferase, partial [Solirubrobacteraceae bacterium]|nr:glycosyltransferase [Solirubrobacteraceae bacterium]
VHIDPRMNGEVAPLAALEPARGDVLLVHYSAYAPKLSSVLDLPNRTLLLSHNVTPARWLWDHEPAMAVQCALGRRQLPAFAARVDVAAGVSGYNAAEIGSDVVVPLLFDPAAFGATVPPPGGPPTLLFVGRLAPHKRQDELIRVLALLRRHRLPDARLVLVGEPLNERYLEALRSLAEQLAPGAVTFERTLSREALAERYRGAHAFVSLSEHEGFCVPLLEAFHFGVPVVARPSGGIPEVAGDAALLVADRDRAVVAELVALAVEDAALAAELRDRGRARLGAYAPERTEAAMRDLIAAA